MYGLPRLQSTFLKHNNTTPCTYSASLQYAAICEYAIITDLLLESYVGRHKVRNRLYEIPISTGGIVYLRMTTYMSVHCMSPHDTEFNPTVFAAIPIYDLGIIYSTMFLERFIAWYSKRIRFKKHA